ncbi:Cobalt-precorrin-6y C5-methyltransferase / Cobalt-precorrin-6y C15-methyltransferase [decarboxylating] [hydrothermal vent metagenome]|uniref:Cobalt-precorrin-6y C5-methyltransferase / Cobalt-precorrin-6y C15-methyltransferase [decarboxylating] n=1 Tax=hydrothermal vent metagenome TaxID=652676 RepID=A0A1W1BKG8_9ZZZZ
MLTITGNGMGDYNFDNLTIETKEFDKIICDKNFKEEAENILKLGYKEAKEYILENYDKEEILYVVTGSPLFFSAGILIARKLPKDKVKIINNTSSKTYLLEKLFISEVEVDTLSLHGRSRIDLTKFLTNSYTFVLCDIFTIDRIKEATKYLNPNDIEVTIGYKLGYPDEIIEQVNLFDFSTKAFNQTFPFVLLIKRLFTPKPVMSLDSEFETERGMITKQYKRHLSLQNLDLEANMILWDVGAGSGSCGIEAYKRYSVKTIFFEKQAQRNEFIKKNLTTHHVCDTHLLEGDAEELFESVEENPDRIFVGGGGTKVIARLPYLYERLTQNGVMLINAITLKNLTQMITVLNEAKIEYKVISLSLTTYKGKLDLIEPERQLFQIKVLKNFANS